MKRKRKARSIISALGGLALLVGVLAGVPIGFGAATASAAASTPVAPLAAPTMGWNSWNHFECRVTQQNIKDAADQIVSRGLDKLGYKYVNVDDCWMASTRDANGHLRPDPVRFPDGMKALADYVHSKGMKFGIYEAALGKTCAGLPGSEGYETTDAKDFAAWGVDLLKYDTCGRDPNNNIEKRYTAMGNALKATGRDIVFSICSSGAGSPWEGWGAASGGSQWRTTHDITARWFLDNNTGSPMGVLDIIDAQKGLEVFSGPSTWNDMDMLEVGNEGLTEDEYRSHFSLWSLMNSPLLLGNDLTKMSPDAEAIVKNADVIAVDQDWAGSQGRLMRDLGGGRQVWAKPMSDGSVAVVLFNRSSAATTITTSAAEVGLGGSSSYGLKDLWSKTTATSTGTISGQVPSHGVVMYRMSRAGTNATVLTAGTHNIADLTPLAASTGWGTTRKNQSADGNTLNIGGTSYANGVGTHADSGIHYWLGKTCQRFTAQVGVDSEVGTKGSVRFQVYGDGKLLTHSDVKRGGQAATTLTAPTSGVNTLELRATDGRDNIGYDHADWADAKLTCGSGTGYEAEGPSATRAGTTNLRACSACSGGSTVGDIGNGPANHVTFTNVVANTTGNQTLTIHYLLDGARSFFISVNGGPDTKVDLTGTSWWSVATKSITVPLQAGANTIKFHNVTAYAPDLDKITLS